ncbi:hypothetical protein IEQ34_009782 [Dendrobium chrysotoxum]|uniref:Uncharacterized protein n=1 Tax=Dendrobium chrysotoxum TaxID=161865 RepID=A0AAV7H026_DENCH|nr:hypothetical protein IEQ34_009782 [Dendrobium chrysotoxum]
MIFSEFGSCFSEFLYLKGILSYANYLVASLCENEPVTLSVLDEISFGSVGRERYQNSTTYAFEGADELIKNTSGTGHLKTPLVGFELDAENLVNLDGVCTGDPEPANVPFVNKLICQNSECDMFGESIVSPPTLPQKNSTGDRVFYPNIGSFSSYATRSHIPTVNGFNPPSSSTACASIAVINSTNSLSSEVSNGSTPGSNLEHTEVSGSHNSVEFTQNFHEGYCNVSDLDDCRELTEAVTDVDSISSHCERGKSEDGDNDDLLGGVFVYSEGHDEALSRGSIGVFTVLLSPAMSAAREPLQLSAVASTTLRHYPQCNDAASHRLQQPSRMSAAEDPKKGDFCRCQT